jgi:hypothetical protein
MAKGMERQAKLLASSTSVMSRNHMSKINPEFAKDILDSDSKPPEASFDNIEDMLAWLDDKEPPDPRRDCPWKCRLDDPGCLCSRGLGQTPDQSPMRAEIMGHARDNI